MYEKPSLSDTKLIRLGLTTVIVAVIAGIVIVSSGQLKAADNAADTSGASNSDAVEDSVDLEYGEYLASDCTSCHSLHVDRDRIIALAGLPRAFLVETLLSYRADERDNPAMTTVAKSLTDDDIQAVAAYLETLPSKASQ